MEIYIADLAEYNAGNLIGFWMDLEGKDADDMKEEITNFLKERGHEEHAVHDYNNVPGSDSLGEYPGLEQLEKIVLAVKEYGQEVVEGFVANFGLDYLNSLPDYFLGEYSSEGDFIEETYLCQYQDLIDRLPSCIQCMINPDKIAKDWETSGYVHFYPTPNGVAVFRN